MSEFEFQEAVIEFQGEEYKVSEPTIELWNQLNQEREYKTEWEFGLSLLCLMTGLSEQEIMECEYSNIKNTTNQLSNWLLETQEKFYEEFEFNGVTYKFIDLNNIKFGEWIDLDFFLQKPITYRQKNLNELMSLLYREKDMETGKVVKYNSMETKKRSILFKQLPVKYLRGAMVFFYALETILLSPTLKYSLKRKLMRMKRKINKLMKNVGDGITRYTFSRVKTSLKWMKSPKNPS